ncbi:MAG: hypothetical protein IK002_06840 [Treponema sp.]|uniref:hypothetical protein n=1 Tax=Treponema sp. TaxID=166 RepID=UPI00298E800D|nr:hypothetical protein [Treponema sp.]MBR5933686.1 hypothetical protein [Treponema sp.]
MVAKLICLIVALTAFSFFMGYNLDNKCDIWLFTTTVKNVPVFMNSLISFAFGVLCSLPIAFFSRLKKQRKAEEKEVRDQQKAKAKERKRSADVQETENKKLSYSDSGKTTREKILDKIQKLKKTHKSSETEQEAE